MSNTELKTKQTTHDLDAPSPSCHVCGRLNNNAIPINELHSSLQDILRANATSADLVAVCQHCLELFNRAQEQLNSHAAIFAQTDHVLPTPLRMGADVRFTGRGVTMAFLDSGFYAHKDLTQPMNRILAYKNIFSPVEDMAELESTDVASWHGMMTSVVAAGNGYLSDGFYRGIASEANVVLVKIGKTGRISEDNIEQGLRWVLANRDKYEIRLVNISAGGDFPQSYLHNRLCRLVEEAVAQGLVIVCAVGNAGLAPGHPVLPPANSPAAISVGGLDDQNSLDRARRGMYRSSYGPTIDGLQKPEVIAPGIWVAAPILPHTPTAAEAYLYAELDSVSNDELRNIIELHAGVDKDLDEARNLPAPLLRQLITIKLHEGNVINQHYKFVDGTSFASPIVASIVACMLQANPSLSPQQVKRILVESAERVPGVEIDRQGWGVVVAGRAVELSLRVE
ncbi:MAG: S8 family serine peptidase [Pyrinomonadaceae bacterium]